MFFLAYRPALFGPGRALSLIDVIVNFCLFLSSLKSIVSLHDPLITLPGALYFCAGLLCMIFLPYGPALFRPGGAS